jgi:hypothetical protein
MGYKMSSTGRGGIRIPMDAYFTPDDLAAKLVGLLPIGETDSVLEPHVGGGAFLRALGGRQILGLTMACDVDSHAPGLHQATAFRIGDFLTCSWEADWIVGNPPFTGFEAHLDKALTLAPNVAFLLRLAVMESTKRIESWTRWPLRKVWVLAERPSFTGGKTDSCAYGWFWFQRGHIGPAEVVPGWLEVSQPAAVQQRVAWLARLRAAIDADHASFDPEIDLYALAMNLRGNADGSAEGTDDAESLRVQWRYLQLRLRCWSDLWSRGSDSALRSFFVAVLEETRKECGP